MNTTKKALFLLVIAIGGFFTSCKEYFDDLQSIGQRVVKLEADSLQFTQQYENLKSILAVLKGHQNIDSVYQDKAGNWVFVLLDSLNNRTPVTLRDGVKGEDGDPFDSSTLSVRDSTNGKTYWIYKGTWLIGDDGKAIEVPIVKGDDAKQVDPRTIDRVPIIAIDPVTRHYMFTYDTIYDPSTGTWRAQENAKWTDTGLVFKGDKGEKGEKGDQGDDGQITIYEGKGLAPYYVYYDESKHHLVIVTPYGSYAIEIESIQ